MHATPIMESKLLQECQRRDQRCDWVLEMQLVVLASLPEPPFYRNVDGRCLVIPRMDATLTEGTLDADQNTQHGMARPLQRQYRR